MKDTLWQELQASECTVLDMQRGEYTGNVVSVKISHPLLKRPRWFVPSQRGNFYSRYTGKESNTYADGFIVVGSLSGLTNRWADGSTGRF